jgi:hypothetical protein
MGAFARELKAGENDVATIAERYLADISGFNIVFGKCVWVKIPPENEDDEVEGNTYFFNGRYYAQFQAFASYYKCDGCNNCDYSTEYVTDLQTYLEASTEYLQEYCRGCLENCGNRRFLEDEAEAANGQQGGGYDCGTCQSQCYSYFNDNGGVDETAYLECQAAYQNEDGIQYYSAPQCSSDGGIKIGLFYDEDCTVKSKTDYDVGFTYDTFHSIEDMCVDCYNTDMCNNLYQGAVHCSDGVNANGNYNYGDMPVCTTFKKANHVGTYNKRRKQKPFWIIFGSVFLALLVSGFAFLSYTYYVRHSKTPLADLGYSGGPNGAELPSIT